VLIFTNVQPSAIEDAFLVGGKFTPVADGALV
jgi:hypothetical protein